MQISLDETGKSLDPHEVSRAVKKYVKQATLNKTGSCHLFRHTMATLMLENGADIRFIHHKLGHSMLSTTEIYTHVAIHKLIENHTATHPARLRRTDGENETDDADTAGPTAQAVLNALKREADEDKKEA